MFAESGSWAKCVLLKVVENGRMISRSTKIVFDLVCASRNSSQSNSSRDRLCNVSWTL